MKTLMVMLALMLLTGCAGKGLLLDVKTEGNNKDVRVSTDYQIENGFKMTRNIQTGEYEIELGSATTKDAEMGVIVELLRMVQALMGAAPPPGNVQ